MNNINFSDFIISDELKRAVSEMGFLEATPIQEQSIPVILQGKDVIGHSATGSGKTAAFGLPALDMIDTNQNPRITQILILCPTRELALQATEELKKFSKYKPYISIVTVYGGEPIERQISKLRAGCQIIIGTPGRIMDHMRRKTVKLSNIKMIILDEADEMLNMGFREDIETILQDAPQERQTVLFSATMPPAILEITKQFQNNPTIVRIRQPQQTCGDIEQFYFEVPIGKKQDALCRLLDYYKPSISMVFCNTKKMVDELVSYLVHHGLKAEGLHGDMKQAQRTHVMNGFRNKRFKVLVATDVAARGIDISNIEIVFNYDLPQDTEYYVHRIGRTGRAGNAGKSFTLISGRRQFIELNDIMRFTKSNIARKNMPTLDDLNTHKTQQFVESIAELIQDDQYQKYDNILGTLREKFDDKDIILALLSKSIKLKSGPDELMIHRQYENAPRVPGKRVIPKKSFFDRSQKCSNMSTIKISIGRRDRVTPSHILGAVAGESGIPGRLIGNIAIEHDVTHVDVPLEHKKVIVESINNIKINGKRVLVIK